MWWLDVCPEPVLAVLCRSEQIHESEFSLAPKCQSVTVESSTDVGPTGWAPATQEARSCLPDDLVAFHSVMIVTASGAKGLGLGPNKACCERAAYVAHAASSRCHSLRGLPQHVLASLQTAAKSAEMLCPVESRYDFVSQKLPDGSAQDLYAAVWHVGGQEECRGYFHEEEATVLERFRQLHGGPYCARVLDPMGQTVKQFGHFNKKNWRWSELHKWWQSHRAPNSSSASVPRSRSPAGRRKTARFHAFVRNGSPYSCSVEGKAPLPGSRSSSQREDTEGRIQCCGEEQPTRSNFCFVCGKELRSEMPAPKEVEVVGFVFEGGEKVLCEEDDWDELRRIVSQRHVKRELDQEDDFELGKSLDPLPIVEVPVEDVWCLQSRISSKLRTGQSLTDLTAQLKDGHVNPKKAGFLLLNMAKAQWYDRRKRAKVTRFYTFDHRRLWCMWKAGFHTVRARVALEGSMFSDFARKADEFGVHVSKLRVNRLS
ncbi:hypothetical protein AK812_SmicGene20253 [Symbiodinium microadriaticum]|uniref:Uncharacterized protein n=1 Tax=Symbiodinium microadriaticum TaxID=2951 RepID=A0A1Q9DQI3_SYMMI|nr:hypothetical protein AK812_SmicGene20253 [Symbiodinium microadriaticum]